MAFRNKLTSFDFGTTPIENLFIMDFLPEASALDLKVYLLGYKYSTNTDFVADNESLARHLNVSVSEVKASWKRWEQQGLVTIDEDFNITFISIRQLYLDNNYGKRTTSGSNRGVLTSTQKLLDAQQSPIIQSMFRNIQDVVRRSLSQNQMMKIIDWFNRFHMEADCIVFAFQYSYDERKIKNFKYVQTILEAWYDQGVVTIEDAENALSQHGAIAGFYKKVLKAMGITHRFITDGERDVLATILDMGFTKDFVLDIIKERTKRSMNINMQYLLKVFEDLNAKNIHNVDDYIADLSTLKIAKEKKSNRPKNTVNNFMQREYDISDEDFESMFGINNNQGDSDE